MPVFNPPTVNDQTRISVDRPDPNMTWEDWQVSQRLFRHGSPHARGRSVLRIGGVYQTIDTPTNVQVDSATEVYLGGHVYVVDQTTADRLTAAGYTVTADAPAPVRDLTWGALTGMTWHDVVVNYGTWG